MLLQHALGYRNVFYDGSRVSIPQAVSAVATMIIDSAKTGLKVVSIPQAVSTVATFNAFFIATSRTVSIPQAVSTVATAHRGSQQLL